MEKTTEDQLLLSYLDGLLDESETRKLEEKIAQSLSLANRLEELRSIHFAIKANSFLESPSKNFTQRVMSRLDSLPEVTSFSPRNGLLLLIGILVAVGIGLALIETGKFDALNGNIALDTLPLRKEWFKNPLPSIPFNGKLVVNILLIVATGLSLILLDRTILRPLFLRRTRLI